MDGRRARFGQSSHGVMGLPTRALHFRFGHPCWLSVPTSFFLWPPGCVGVGGWGRVVCVCVCECVCGVVVCIGNVCVRACVCVCV